MKTKDIPAIAAELMAKMAVDGFSQETKRSLSFLFDDAVIMGYLDLSDFLNESSYEWELFHEKDSEFCDSLKEVYMSYYKKVIITY